MALSLSKSELVIKYIRQMIVDGELSKGDLVPSEFELSSACGISRGTVRKALAMLNDKGLIETRKGIGSFVMLESFLKESDDQKKQLIKDFRSSFLQGIHIKKLIDPEIAKYLARYAEEAELSLIESAFTIMEESINHNAQYKAAGHNFHMSFVYALNYPALTTFYETLEKLEDPYDQLLFLSEEARKEIKGVDLEQHRDIMNAILNKDQDKAYFLTKLHLDYFEEYYSNWAPEQS